MRYRLILHTYTDLEYTFSGLSALLNYVTLLRDCPYPLSIRPE